uniref:Uncharacterized protein n=1 Tax=Arundo donax TaxID=35708 RepID=A0A0A9C9D3_ARUDO
MSVMALHHKYSKSPTALLFPLQFSGHHKVQITGEYV